MCGTGPTGKIVYRGWIYSEKIISEFLTDKLVGWFFFLIDLAGWIFSTYSIKLEVELSK
jgi:hypothetical protein